MGPMKRPRWDRLAIVLMCLAAFLDAGINARAHAVACPHDAPVRAADSAAPLTRGS